MAFKVTTAKWLEIESARVAQIMLMPRFWGVKWTHPKLREELSKIGLNYSAADIDELNGELHKQGIVEDVNALEPFPEPFPEPFLEPIVIEPTG